jgi:hypothetical protein
MVLALRKEHMAIKKYGVEIQATLAETLHLIGSLWKSDRTRVGDAWFE